MKIKNVRLCLAVGALGITSLATVGYAVAQSGGTETQESRSVPGETIAGLPSRVAVAGPDGNWAGFADQTALTANPNMAAYPNDPQAAVEAFWREMVPVTRTEDRGSELVGHLLRGYGFVDLATEQSADFNIDALLAEGQARRDRDNAAHEEAVRSGKVAPPEDQPISGP